MTYVGLTSNTSTEEAHLGGNIREGDPFTHSPLVWKYLVERFAVKSVLDLGSGLGYSASYFAAMGKTVIAVEGLKENVDSAVYPTIQVDLEKSPVHCVVDLVHCQEVVEHIDEKYLDNLLASLACGKFAVITHATPGQGGWHHVNEKPQEYWVSHMARFKCVLLHEDTKRVRNLASQDNAIYLAKTGMVFANKSR